MVTINAHFDGKSIVLDEPLSVPLHSGARLRIKIETLEEIPAATSVGKVFQPLNIHITPDLADAIALDPEFNIENS